MNVCDNCRKELDANHEGHFELDQKKPFTYYDEESARNSPGYMFTMTTRAIRGDFCSLKCVVEFASAKLREG